MAIYHSNDNTVTVEKGDTLSQIALDYSKQSGGKTYQQLAALNDIPNPDLIYVNQIIYLKGKTTISSSTNSNKVTITAFGLQANSENTLFAVWAWSKSYTDKYQISWEYDTGDGVWFVGSSSSISVDSLDWYASRQSTYSIPSNAKRVRFRVKPVAKTYSSGSYRWTGAWCAYQYYNVSDSPPKTPATPTVEIEQYKLTAKLENLDVNATHIEFQIVKDDTSVFKTGTAKIVTNSASYSCNVTAGSEYKVRCRSNKGTQYSDWTDYTSNVKTAPAATSITSCAAASETSVLLKWKEVSTAETYEIEYTTEKRYFDTSNEPTSVGSIKTTEFEVTGLESGDEYFFRVRAVGEKGESGWSDIKSAIVGKTPAAPTTWSSTSTAMLGESVTLYWVHNSEDGSSQTYADLELIVDGQQVATEVIKNSTDEDEKDKTSSLVLTTDSAEAEELKAAGRNYILIATTDGTNILWRVRTAGITNTLGEYSVQREINIHAPATLEFRVTDSESNVIDTVTQFPFYIYGLGGPSSQVPIGYHLSIISNEIYETVDVTGNTRTINAGDAIYSKYFDISTEMLVEMSAGNIDLENNVSYTANCKVTMDTGLTAESSQNFTVNWTDIEYAPNAEITIDTESFVAHIHPYCEHEELVFYKAEASGSKYALTDTVVEIEEGVAMFDEDDNFIYTATGEQVFSGTTTGGESVYYCTIVESSMVENVKLSVYRREFDGSFTELATGLNNLSNTHITDPHPSLDFARYRIVAVTEATGTVCYYDIPGVPVEGKAIIIQWDEDWSNFDVTSDDDFEQPPWAGSMLKLPYNVDVSDSHRLDVTQVSYIGRPHPVTYYGTQLGHTSTWNTEIPATDKETLYGIRRLARWLGDVYVREPSGSGYWASINVSYNQKHCGLTIPVTFDVTRVEGGV